MRHIKPSVMSQRAVESYKCDIPHINISIASPDGNEAALPNNLMRLDTLFLRFHDLTRPVDDLALFVHEYGVQPVYFDNKHAEEIKSFVSKHAEAEHIICNCEAGRSRSAAVAAALAKYLTGDDEYYFSQHHPNMLIFRELLRVLETPPLIG